MNNKGADQPARMRRLNCVFVARLWQKQVVSHDVAHLVFCYSFSYLRGLLIIENLVWELRNQRQTSDMLCFSQIKSGVALVVFLRSSES